MAHSKMEATRSSLTQSEAQLQELNQVHAPHRHPTMDCKYSHRPAVKRSINARDSAALHQRSHPYLLKCSHGHRRSSRTQLSGIGSLMQSTVAFLVLLSLAVTPACAVQQIDTNDIQQFLQTIEEDKQEQGGPQLIDNGGLMPARSVSVMWGIADATAVAGKVFKYPLPEGAFKGQVTGYKVRYSLDYNPLLHI